MPGYIIEPKQRSRHFCCHRTFMCWHSLTSRLPLARHGPLVHADLPFIRLPSTQKKTNGLPKTFFVSQKRNFYTPGTVKPLQVCRCPGVSRVFFPTRKASRGRNSSLLADSLVRASECSSLANPTSSVVGCRRHLSSAPTPFHEAPFRRKAPK